MALDFYNAFGHDNYGIIGNGTTVNPINMIGIDMTTIQALEQGTTDLKAENNAFMKDNVNVKEENQKLKNALDSLNTQLKTVEELLRNK